MGSEAHIAVDVGGAPQDVAAKVEKTLLEQKCTIDQKSPDGLTLDFTTRKTLLSWELQGRIAVSPSPQGSRIDLVLNTHRNRPVALMDGVKNEKSAKKLMEKISAAV